MDFYIGQIFEAEYPPQAAEWCNEQGNCYIAEIESTDEYIKQYQIVEIPQPTLEEEKQRIAMLALTGADVERGIYKAKGMDFEDIIALVTQLQPQGIDIKALKIELKANNFYRGNCYVDAIGAILGFDSKQLDEFFETNDYTKLIGIQNDMV